MDHGIVLVLNDGRIKALAPFSYSHMMSAFGATGANRVTSRLAW